MWPWELSSAFNRHLQQKCMCVPSWELGGQLSEPTGSLSQVRGVLEGTRSKQWGLKWEWGISELPCSFTWCLASGVASSRETLDFVSPPFLAVQEDVIILHFGNRRCQSGRWELPGGCSRFFIPGLKLWKCRGVSNLAPSDLVLKVQQ